MLSLSAGENGKSKEQDFGVVAKYLPFIDKISPEDLTFYLTIAMKILSIVMDQAELYEFCFKNDYAD